MTSSFGGVLAALLAPMLVGVGVSSRGGGTPMPRAAVEWASLRFASCNHVCSTCNVSSQHKNVFNLDSPTHEGGGHDCAVGDGTGCNPPAHPSCQPQFASLPSLMRTFASAITGNDVDLLTDLLSRPGVTLNLDRGAIQIFSKCGLVLAHLPISSSLMVELSD